VSPPGQNGNNHSGSRIPWGKSSTGSNSASHAKRLILLQQLTATGINLAVHGGAGDH